MHRRLTAVWMAAVLGITSCPLPAAAAMLPENANFEEEAQEEESFESFGYEEGFQTEADAGFLPEELEDNEWTRYQNSAENNGIVSAKLPLAEDNSVMKWATRMSSGYTNSFTPPLILGGDLYVQKGSKILRLSKEDGSVIQESEPLEGNAGYGLNPLTYAEGLIFAAIGNGQIQAVNASTLESVWVSEPLGGQTISPIAYADGYVYTGTWNSETDDGVYFCLSIDDQEPEQKTEAKKPVWIVTHKGGFYWAGAYVEEGADGNDYVIFGSDDGEENGAVLYSVCTQTGEVVSQAEGFQGDIRSSIVYDEGKVYFVTKGGYLYRASLENGQLDQVIGYDLGGMATATPVVYNDRIYVGVCGQGNQFDPESGHSMAVLEDSEEGIALAYEAEVPGYPQAAALLSDAYVQEDYDGDGVPDQRVYLYFTYNAGPGGIYCLSDEPGQTEGEAKSVFTPPVGKRQFCISPLCVDSDGTIYYKNDSGYLMAIQSAGAYLENVAVSADVGEVQWNKAFDSGTKEYFLTADQAASQLTFTIDCPQGQSATVDGEACDGTYVMELGDEKEGQIEIEVTDGENSASYIFHVALQENKPEAVKAVEAKIDEIGSVTVDSEGKITDARKAYEELTEAEKSLVKNYENLLEAEEQLKVLKEEREAFVSGRPEVKAEAVSYNSIMLTWEPYENAKSYYVYRKVKGGSFKKIAWVQDLSDLSYTDKTAVTGTVYYYTVKAASKKWSEPVYSKYVTDLTAKAVLEKPSIGKAQTWGYNGIKVTWDEVAGADGYRLYYKTGNSAWKYATQTAGTSYTHTGVITGQDYTYYVRAYRTVNKTKVFSAYSDGKTGKAVPKKAVISKVMAGSKKAALKWNKVNGASGYRIYYKTSENGAWHYVTQIGKGSTTSYTDTGLKSGQTYYYTMRAYRTVNGEKIFGSYSDWKTVKVK